MICAAVFLWLGGTASVPYLPWLCLASLLVTGRHLVVEAKLPSFFTWFATTYMALFLVYPVVASLFAIELNTTDSIFLSYCMLVVIGIHLFILAYDIAGGRPAKQHPESYGVSTSSTRLLNALLILLAVNIVAALLVIADYGSLSQVRFQSRGDMKLNTGTLSVLGTHLFSLGAFLYPLVAVHIRKHPPRALFWIPLLIALEIFVFLAFRTRSYPMMHGVGLVIGWFIIAPRLTIHRSSLRIRRRLTASQKLGLIALMVSLVLGMFVLRVFRGNFERASSLAEIEIDVWGSVQYAFEGGGELGYSEWVFKILEIVPDHRPYLNGQSYYRLLFVPIPRSIWPEKPYNSQIVIAQYLEPGASRILSRPVGVIGDLYVNFGMVGVLGMLVFGYGIGRLDRGQQLTHALILSVSFATIFHLARGGFTNQIVELVVFFVTARFIVRFLSGVSSRKQRPTTRQATLPAPPQSVAREEAP